MFIEISNLKKSYKSGVVITEVLKGIGMQLEMGEIGVISVHPVPENLP